MTLAIFFPGSHSTSEFAITLCTSDYGFFVNASGFVFGFSILCYTFWYKPENATEDENGAIYGLMAVIAILFIYMNMSIRSSPQELFDQGNEEGER